MKDIKKSDYNWFIRRLSGILFKVDEGESVNCGQSWLGIAHKDGSFTYIPNIHIAEVLLEPKETAKNKKL